jgi:SAM-dependent methyltransferase
VLVVGAGRQLQEVLDMRGSRDEITVTCVDIDVRADVDYFCDAHNLAFQDGVFSAVITTAVLEHVLDPQQVADEIHRVLAADGLVYSELPFMQQVHEGAYDFSRFTLGGHRWLLRNFVEIESGAVAGPGTALVWAIEHFAMSAFRSATGQKMARGVARCLFFWLKYFDFVLANRPAALDSASCTYYYGRKAARPLTQTELVSRYTGAKVTEHV